MTILLPPRFQIPHLEECIHHLLLFLESTHKMVYNGCKFFLTSCHKHNIFRLMVVVFIWKTHHARNITWRHILLLLQRNKFHIMWTFPCTLTSWCRNLSTKHKLKNTCLIKWLTLKSSISMCNNLTILYPTQK